MKQFVRHIFLLVAMLVASTNLSAQTYNGGTWYSLYDTEQYDKTSLSGKDFGEKAVFPPAESVIFEYKKLTLGSTNGEIRIYNKDASGNYRHKGGANYNDYNNWKWTSEITLDSDISHVQYRRESGNGVCVRNRFVKLKKHIRLADGGFGATSDSKSFGSVTIDGQSAAQKVTLRSFLTAGNITVTSSDNAFRINSASNLSGLTYAVGANACASANGQSGAQAGGATLGDINQYAFDIYFCPTEAKEYSATITITDGTSTATVTVSGVGVKKTQQLTWAADFQADEVSLPVGKEIVNPATINSGLALTYTSSDETVLAVEGTTIKALKAGEVTLTVEQAGDDNWNAVSATKTIKVTEKTIQFIHWIDNLTRLVVGGEPVQLTATAQILRNVETEEIIDAPERTALITYQSANDNVVTINGTTLTIVGEGETTVTATLPGDDTYEATSISMPVRVRVPSTACEAYVLDAPEEYSYAAAAAGSYTPVDFTGPGHILTFQARSGNSTRVGPIIYEQYVNGEWKKLDNGNPETDWRDYRYELDRNATKVRFRNEAGSYRRYFKNVLVTQATYLETTTPEITVEKSIVGDEIRRDILVQYSNIPAGTVVSNKSALVRLSDDEIDTDCGTYGEKQITLTCNPLAVGTINDTITIYEEVSGFTLTIPVAIHTQMTEQNLYWDVPTQPITSCSDLQLPTHTTGGLAIEWSVIEGGEYATLDANGHLLIYATGNVTLQAANAGNAIYAPFSQTYTISVAYNPIFLGTEDDDWNNPSNWNVCHLPSETDVVTVQASAVLEEQITVGGLIFHEGGSMQILSKGGLTVGVNGITGAKDDGSSIIIDNTPQGAGFLKVNPETTNKPSKVTVNYSTEAYNSGNPRDEVWQYMGAPGSDMQMSDANKTMIYHWDEQQGWLKMSNTNLQPFVGYAFTQNKADSASFQIQATPIIPDKEQEITLTLTQNGMRGSNLFVNSFLAPIDLATFDNKDFTDGVEQTFYLYNSGSWKQWQNNGGATNQMTGDGTSPGQYYAITPGSAAMIDASQDQTTIPPMQGVYVVTQKDGAKIKLDYAKHVYAAKASNQPMRAPQRISEDFKRVRLHVNSQNSGADRMYVIQHEAGTAGYDNGYDARNMAVNGQVAIYTHELDGQMEISVSDKIDSTYIGFRAGSDSEYTLRITSVVGEEMYLKDLVDNILIPVVDGQDYTFSATPNSVNDTRFLLLGQKSGVATDIEEVQVYIHDNMVHVMEAPENSSMSIYTVGGVTVANYSIGYAPCTIDLLDLPTGVYVLRINDKAYKFVCK